MRGGVPPARLQGWAGNWVYLLRYERNAEKHVLSVWNPSYFSPLSPSGTWQGPRCVCTLLWLWRRLERGPPGAVWPHGKPAVRRVSGCRRRSWGLPGSAAPAWRQCSPHSARRSSRLRGSEGQALDTFMVLCESERELRLRGWLLSLVCEGGGERLLELRADG